MTISRLAPQLNYLPARDGGEDQLHTHTDFNPSSSIKESCGACAQLENDFRWLRLHDAVADRIGEFADREEVLADARVDALAKLEAGDLRAFRDPELVAV